MRAKARRSRPSAASGSLDVLLLQGRGLAQDLGLLARVVGDGEARLDDAGQVGPLLALAVQLAEQLDRGGAGDGVVEHGEQALARAGVRGVGRQRGVVAGDGAAGLAELAAEDVAEAGREVGDAAVSRPAARPSSSASSFQRVTRDSSSASASTVSLFSPNSRWMAPQVVIAEAASSSCWASRTATRTRSARRWCGATGPSAR
jgi:hypothetical protein